MRFICTLKYGNTGKLIYHHRLSFSLVLRNGYKLYVDVNSVTRTLICTVPDIHLYIIVITLQRLRYFSQFKLAETGQQFDWRLQLSCNIFPKN